MNKKVKIVIIGGGFAGSRACYELSRQGFQNIILIDQKNYFEVTYATLRAVVEPQIFQKKIRKLYDDFLNIKIVHDQVIEISKQQVITKKQQTFSYDYLVIASGSAYPLFPIAKPETQFTVEEREKQFITEYERIKKAKIINVIGAGAVGVELAGELADHFPQKSIHLFHNQSRLLNQLSEKAGQIALDQLKQLSVQIHLNEIIEPENEEKTIFISKINQTQYCADLTYYCTGVKINTRFMENNFTSSLNGRKAIQVDQHLMVKGYQHIFAIGDCNNFNEAKLGYLADLQGKYAATAIKKLINGQSKEQLPAYQAHSMLSIVPIGKKSGLIQLPRAVFTHPLFINMKQKDLFIKRAFSKVGVK